MIGKVIKYKFDNTDRLNDVFAGRVYPLVGVQSGERPFCVYDTTSIRPEGSKDADSHIDIVNVELNLVGETYSQLQTAVEDIRTAFVRMKETIESVNVQSCGFDNLTEVFNVDEETYAVSVDLVFRIVKS
jgi:hypothetical protein